MPKKKEDIQIETALSDTMKEAEQVIEFMELQEYRFYPVEHLSFGIQKRVEVARALTMQPDLLLFDEPLAGMSLQDKEELVFHLLKINNERKITVVLIEHDLGVVMDISDKVYVLNFGKVIGQGPPDEVAQSAEVVKAYIGKTT